MKFFTINTLLKALSALILCYVTLSRRSNSNTAVACKECEAICAKGKGETHVYRYKDFGKDGNKNVVVKCAGKPATYYVKDLGWPNNKFKSVPAEKAEKNINKGNYFEIDRNGNRLIYSNPSLLKKLKKTLIKGTTLK